MNLLIITPYIPYPLDSGGNKAQFRMIDQLRKKYSLSLLLQKKNLLDDKNIDLLKQEWPNVHFFVYDKNLENNHLKKRRLNFLLKIKASVERKIRRIYRKEEKDPIRIHSSLSIPFYNPLEKSFVEFVYDTVSKNTFDIIQVEFFDLLSLGYVLPENAVKLFVHHEIRYVRQNIELSLLNKRTPYDNYLYMYLHNYEKFGLMQFNGIISFSEIDKLKLQQILPEIPIYSSPSIDVCSDKTEDTDFNFNNKLVFLGGASHFPNKDGLDWFLQNCWPYIRKVKPEIELNIIGSWRKSEKQHYESMHQKVHFLGFVEILSSALKDAIMIVPIRIGSGIRIKILDGINVGCPIVSTTVGVEGIDLIPGKNIFIQDTPRLFSDAILQLASSPSLCKTFIKEAKLLLQEFGSDKQIQKREQVYQKALSRSTNKL